MKKSGNRTPQTRRRTQPSVAPAVKIDPEAPDEIDPAQLDLMAGVAEAVAYGHPLALLELVSTFASCGSADLGDPSGPGHATTSPSYDELLRSFMEVRIPETSAILAVAAATHPDELFRSKARHELLERRHKLPGWLRHLDFTVTGCDRLTEPYGDGENIVIGVRAGTGREFTLTAYVEHQTGSVVKDAFATELSLAEHRERLLDTMGAEDLTIESIDRAEARAKLKTAIDNGTRLDPPYIGETWPGCRALIEWVLATMPTGGAAWERPSWTERDRARLADDFFASQAGHKVDEALTREVVERLIGFGADHGTGDPLRWSPTTLKRLLDEHLPETEVSHDVLVSVPRILPLFIKFAHQRSGIEQWVTKTQSLAALAEFLPDYRHWVDSGEPKTPDPPPTGRLRLRATLDGPKPAIWRLMDVDADLTLADLHAILQTSFGWENSHLHAFSDAAPGGRRQPTRRWTASPRADTMDEDLAEEDWTIARALEGTKGSLFYEYDFGDSWQVRIDAEPVEKAPKRTRAALVDGARRGPLEDSGGMWGYAELIEAIGDPTHERHEELTEWLDEVWGIEPKAFDPAAFDAESVNAALQTLRL